MLDKCRICGNEEDNQIYRVKERRLNKGDDFNYLYCSKCGTLQLADDIDSGEFYTDSYYSFHLETPKKPGILRRCIVKLITKEIPIPESLMYVLRKVCGFSSMIIWATKIKEDSMIIDVGGGNGSYAEELRLYGFKNVCCVDKFCDSTPFDNISFITGELTDIKGDSEYDLIMFNHSFEHMDNGLEVLNEVYRLLKDDGICLIRIPICENHVWNKYHEYWENIDAPRHYFLYTPRSMDYLCRKAGLTIKRIRWDSYGGQMDIAKNYYEKDHGGQMINDEHNSIWKKVAFWHKTDMINRKKIGDTAAFYIVKNKEEI